MSALRIAGGAALLALTVAACGGASNGASSAGSATATKPATTTKTTPAPKVTKVAAAVSTVKGRAHDAGTIVSSKTVGGLTVLVLDRWSVKGMSDATLAAKGAPIAPHSGTRYYDQNKGKTYTVPVNPSAPIVVNSCTKNGSNPPTMTSTPVSLSVWLAESGRSKTIVLLTYDSSGRLTRLDTDPSC